MLRLIWRAIFFAAYTSKIVLEIYLKGKLLPGFSRQKAMQVRRRWAIRLLHGLGIRGKTEGTPPNFPCLLVCNHRSFIDPILILRHLDAFPVSKSEVKNWPVLGYGAQLSGIILVERESNRSRVATLKTIGATIQSGHPVILFPEGTTGAQPTTLEFRKGAFQIAAKMGLPVVPAAMHFHDPSDFWIGRESFLGVAKRMFRKKNIGIDLRYGPAFQSDDAQELLTASKNWIDTQLLEMQTIKSMC